MILFHYIKWKISNLIDQVLLVIKQMSFYLKHLDILYEDDLFWEKV